VAKQQRDKRQAEEAERKRGEPPRKRGQKLQQLVSKFGRRGRRPPAARGCEGDVTGRRDQGRRPVASRPSPSPPPPLPPRRRHGRCRTTGPQTARGPSVRVRS